MTAKTLICQGHDEVFIEDKGFLNSMLTYTYIYLIHTYRYSYKRYFFFLSRIPTCQDFRCRGIKYIPGGNRISLCISRVLDIPGKFENEQYISLSTTYPPATFNKTSFAILRSTAVLYIDVFK